MFFLGRQPPKMEILGKSLNFGIVIYQKLIRIIMRMQYIKCFFRVVFKHMK